MSVSSNSRKEDTRSNAAKRMDSTMGLHPEEGLNQLNDKSLEHDLPSRRADFDDTSVADDYQDAVELTATTDTDGPTDADIDESRRASWGQAPADEELTTDEDSPSAAYDRRDSASQRVPDADWNTSTDPGSPSTTYGHS